MHLLGNSKSSDGRRRRRRIYGVKGKGAEGSGYKDMRKEGRNIRPLIHFALNGPSPIQWSTRGRSESTLRLKLGTKTLRLSRTPILFGHRPLHHLPSGATNHCPPRWKKRGTRGPPRAGWVATDWLGPQEREQGCDWTQTGRTGLTLAKTLPSIQVPPRNNQRGLDLGLGMIDVRTVAPECSTNQGQWIVCPQIHVLSTTQIH